jgi:four helix bundle protein
MKAVFIMPLRHEKLVAWQRADDLFIRLHIVSKSFPLHERFELGSQLRRAAYSVPANIAEGFARRQPRGRLYLLGVAESSLAEVGYCVHAAHRLGYLSDELKTDLILEVRRVGAPLSGLVRATMAEVDGRRPDPA